MSKKKITDDMKEIPDLVELDLLIYGNAFLHISDNGIRRIDPTELLKEAKEFHKYLPTEKVNN